MNPAQKALWFIESHLGGPLTLDEIASVAGISRFHMVRAFAAATRFPVMRWPAARPIFFMSRWMLIMVLTKHSPARSATSSV